MMHYNASLASHDPAYLKQNVNLQQTQNINFNNSLTLNNTNYFYPSYGNFINQPTPLYNQYYPHQNDMMLFYNQSNLQGYNQGHERVYNSHDTILNNNSNYFFQQIEPISTVNSPRVSQPNHLPNPIQQQSFASNPNGFYYHPTNNFNTNGLGQNNNNLSEKTNNPR